MATTTDFFSLHARRPCVLRPDWQTASRMAVSHKSWLQVIKTGPDNPQQPPHSKVHQGRMAGVTWLRMLPTLDAQCKTCASALSTEGDAHPSQILSVCLSVATVYRGQIAVRQQSSHRRQISSLLLSMSRRMDLDAAQFIELWPGTITPS